MSKIMIYATTDKAGGNVENVWGYQMLTRSIDSSNKDEVEQAKKDGWSNKAQDVIEQVEAEKLQAENKVMKTVLADGADKDRINELEEQLSQALTEIAGLEETVTELTDKVEAYEKSKDVNGDSKVSYDEMEKDDLKTLLDERGVKYVSRDNLDDLIQKAKDSE